MRLRGVGDHACQGGLAGSGRSVKDDRTKQSISLDCPPQQAAFPQDVTLPDDFIERPRTHTSR